MVLGVVSVLSAGSSAPAPLGGGWGTSGEIRRSTAEAPGVPLHLAPGSLLGPRAWVSALWGLVYPPQPSLPFGRARSSGTPRPLGWILWM